MKRRSFLKNSLLSAGAVYAEQRASLARSKAKTPKGLTGEKVRLTSRHLSLEYDLGKGRASLFFPDGSPLLLNATAAAVFPNGQALAADSNYSRQGSTSHSKDPVIPGSSLTVTCRDSNKRLDLELLITLLEDQPGAVFEVVLVNVSGTEILVRHAEPVRALLNEGAGCAFGAKEQWTSTNRVLTNGYMYYDPGSLLHSDSLGHQDFTSYWNAAFHRPDTRQTLVMGYLENRTAEGQVVAGWDMARGWPAGQASFNLTARSLFNQYFVLKPGANMSSGRVLILLSPDPFSGLEAYAETCGRLHQVKLNPIINGWCSWFYTHTTATEEEQLRNAEFISKHLKPYGMEWVQIDDGYQRAFGDWDGNNLYPHGMKWLAERIRGLGLKPGIWVAPSVISENTDVARNHPDWLVHDADGSVHVSANPRAKYALDVTHPGAREWLYNLFRTIAGDWGYDFIKIDFVEWSLLAAERYYDPAMSRAQAYRLFMETIRKAIGPNRHLLDCGPAPVSVGLLDSTRIELDIAHLTWDQYTKNFNSNAPAMAKRYYFHKRTWINDADHLGLNLLTLSQAQAAASLIALSGGNMISGDRLYELDGLRLETLRKVLPTFGEAARPLDLFETAYPEIFALPIRKDSESWWLVGYFNYDENATAVKVLDLTRLGLDPGKTYLIYEFWSQQLVAETTRSVSLRFGPSSVNLLAIREKKGVPQLLGTDRHYTQGGIELEDVHWDQTNHTLSGRARGTLATAWKLAIYVPNPYAWDEERPDLLHDYRGYSAVSDEDKILRATLNFAGTDRIDWTFRFKRS